MRYLELLPGLTILWYCSMASLAIKWYYFTAQSTSEVRVMHQLPRSSTQLGLCPGACCGISAPILPELIPLIRFSVIPALAVDVKSFEFTTCYWACFCPS